MLPFAIDIDEGLRAQRFTNEPTEHVRGEPGSFESGEVRTELELETPSISRRRSSPTPRSPTGRRTS